MEGEMAKPVGQAGISEMLSGRRLDPALKRAMSLLESIKDTEREQLEMGIDYPEQHVRLSVVHTRQDVVLIFSYLNSIAETTRIMVNWIAFIGWLVLAMFIFNTAVPFLKSMHWWPF